MYIYIYIYIYVPVVIKIQTFNEFTVARLPDCQFIYTPWMPRIHNHKKYIYSLVVKGMVQ